MRIDNFLPGPEDDTENPETDDAVFDRERLSEALQRVQDQEGLS